MTDTNTITLPRSVVEQALEALFMYKPMVTGVTFQHGLDAMQALRAALEQPQDHTEQHLDMVPDGWKLVPMEPTPEMIKEMYAYDGTQYSNPFGSDDFKDDYRNMLAAAPKPPVVEQPQQEQEWKRHLGNLLAVIHRDGGHYIEEHGWEKAQADAEERVVRVMTGLPLSASVMPPAPPSPKQHKE